ncbi:hypothetical protein CONPUDRAFT_68847 [Coniophora puteana RWD-64-598 SS2]|uniref:Uncharacterized protein n=1 Tax=Coniophora puteana (strain RWD-64-598) TaxID=741705 RepID=A0A5M3N4R8_CONPW|nr:uncharacterized protein CONPUDRAFT_68847 [Coniophora puteana RWD-64-598 SS2]EIW86296.1 hypothetical protein CONPUDRAFT_68847 [Coniophora puteana RWD-64-598 SS2]
MIGYVDTSDGRKYVDFGDPLLEKALKILTGKYYPVDDFFLHDQEYSEQWGWHVLLIDQEWLLEPLFCMDKWMGVPKKTIKKQARSLTHQNRWTCMGNVMPQFIAKYLMALAPVGPDGINY